MLINSISCGQGAPSLYLIPMAGRGEIRADIVIVADTGFENDMLWSNGKRTTAREFFELVTRPLSKTYGIDAVFVRALDSHKKPRPALQDDQRYNTKLEIDIPMFGSMGGRLKQSCTGKWKKDAVRQELRRRGATNANVALGLTLSEVDRMKQSDRKWENLYWPLIDARLYRATINERLDNMNIPYLVTSQCDGCPHKDYFRWSNNTTETIEKMAQFEKQVGRGEFFLTNRRIPLKDALAKMQSERSIDIFDACESGFCFT